MCVLRYSVIFLVHACLTQIKVQVRSSAVINRHCFSEINQSDLCQLIFGLYSLQLVSEMNCSKAELKELYLGLAVEQHFLFRKKLKFVFGLMWDDTKSILKILVKKTEPPPLQNSHYVVGGDKHMGCGRHRLSSPSFELEETAEPGFLTF